MLLAATNDQQLHRGECGAFVRLESVAKTVVRKGASEMIRHVRKLLAGGLLAVGLLGMALPARAVTVIDEVLNERNTPGEDWLPLSQAFSTDLCVITGFSTGDTPTQSVWCRADKHS